MGDNKEEKVELSKYYVNKKIKGYILSDNKMREAGFILVENSGGNAWYYSRGIDSVEVSFNVTIYVSNPEEPRIDVLDESWLQPYDYQAYLVRDPEFKVALVVRDFVEKQMDKLQKAGILSGHVPGEYI